MFQDTSAPIAQSFSIASKRQQSTSVGPAFDGSTGVDSEDVLSIPQIGFGSFQLFPDQYSYALSEPSGPLSANESLQVGLNFIQLQAEAAARYKVTSKFDHKISNS